MIKLGNWVGERTTTIGAGAIVMVGRLDGFASFSILGDGEVYYTIQDGIAKETGIGTLTGNVMVRDKVSATIDSVGNYSTENTPIYLSGNAHVFCTANADFMEYLYNGIDTVDASVLKAAASAEAAALSQSKAELAATAADSSKVAAAGSEALVKQYSDAAAASATSANASKIAAATSEAAAAGSVTKAANSATAAATSATNAGKSETNAQSAATAAAGSATAAANSESGAQTSALTAVNANMSAKGHAEAAKKSKEDTAAIALSIGNATNAAEASATAAARHEVAAQSAAGSAQDSASVAQIAEVGAVAAKDKAQEIADSIEGMVLNPIITKGELSDSANLNMMINKSDEGFYTVRYGTGNTTLPIKRDGSLTVIVSVYNLNETTTITNVFQMYSSTNGRIYFRYKDNISSSNGFGGVGWKSTLSSDDLSKLNSMVVSSLDGNKTTLRTDGNASDPIVALNNSTKKVEIRGSKGIAFGVSEYSTNAELLYSEETGTVLRLFDGNILVRPSLNGSDPIIGFEMGRDEFVGITRPMDKNSYCLSLGATDMGEPTEIKFPRGIGDALVLDINAKIDTNGFYKKSSPILTIDGDGKYTTNEESKNVIVTRTGVGVYELSNTLGYNSDKAWGADGGISIPMNNNGLNLIYVDDRINPDGSITIETFHRQHDTLPERFQNWRVKEVTESGERVFYKDGEVCDIPPSRHIDVRVNIPNGEAPKSEE